MKNIFRLYSSINSSFFDLISGDKETQQTKGLGLLLSKSKTALMAFLEISQIKEKIGKIDFNNVDRLIVNCELISKSTNSYRADILLRFYKEGRPLLAIFVETKSINKGTSVYITNKQLEKYLDSKIFYELEEFENKCVGITLTKLPSYTNHDRLISITWEDIINAFYKVQSNQDILLKDYFNFLTNINGTMKFYEKEVLSIPTAKESNQAIDKFKVYECPNSGKYLLKHKPLYLTFRKNGGGEMKKLFKVDEIIILNFADDYLTFLDDENYALIYRERIKNYVEYFLNNKIWQDLPRDEKQVFLLADNPIELGNKPKPKNGNNSFRAYYELADILQKSAV